MVPLSYMKRAASFKVDNSSLREENNSVYQGYGYGYQFLLNPKDTGYRSEGAHGQIAIAIPEKKASIAVMSLDKNPRRIHSLIFEMIVDRL